MASIVNPKDSLPAGASIPSLMTTFFCLCTWLCLWYWSVDSVWLSIFPSGGLMLSGAGANFVFGVSPWMYTGFLQIRLCHNIHRYFGFGYKGLVFCKNNGWIMENMDKGLTVTKWMLIVMPEISQNAPKFIFPICLLKSKSSGFQWKRASLCIHSPWVGEMKELVW